MVSVMGFLLDRVTVICDRVPKLSLASVVWLLPVCRSLCFSLRLGLCIDTSGSRVTKYRDRMPKLSLASVVWFLAGCGPSVFSYV